MVGRRFPSPDWRWLWPKPAQRSAVGFRPVCGVTSLLPDRSSGQRIIGTCKNTLGTLNVLLPTDRKEHMSFAFDSEPSYHFNRLAIAVPLLELHGLIAASSEKHIDGPFSQSGQEVSAAALQAA